MVNTTNPHYITQNATGTSLTQPVDTVDFPHSGLIKALNQMAGGNVVVKTGADFDINQTGSSPANLVVAAGKILRNGKYHEVGTKTFADSSLTTTYAKGYHLLVVADGREGGETINELYLRPPTATLRVPEFKLGDTIVAVIEYSSGTSAGSRLIQYLTTNKESNSLSIAYGDGSDPNKVYTQAMTVDAVAGDVTFENIVPDKDIIFKVNDGGTPTEIMRIDGSTSRIGIGTNSPDAMLHLSSGVDQNPQVILENTQNIATDNSTDEPELIFKRSGSSNSGTSGDIGKIRFIGKDDGDAFHDYCVINVDAPDETAGTEDGRILIYLTKTGNSIEHLRMSGSEGVIFNHETNDINFMVAGNTNENVFFIDAGTERVGIGTGSPFNKLQVNHTGTDGDNGMMIIRKVYDQNEDGDLDDAVDQVSSGQILGGIGFDSDDGNVPSSVLESSAFISANATENHGTGDKGGNLKFGVSLINENDDVVSTIVANVGPPDTTANATTYAGLNSRATTAIVAAATYAPTIGDSGTLVIFEHANSNLTLPSINNTTSVGVQFTVFNETGSDIESQITTSNSATINGASAGAPNDDIESYKAATFVCSGNNTWIRIG